MRLLRALVLIALFAVGAYYVYSYLSHRSGPVSADTITVYYTKPDGETVVPWRVSLGPARDRRSIAFYAATQALAGPPAGVEAIRFPPGTIARSVDVDA
ncbi:MAG TPA: hypothetical protein VKG44_02975, partial [Candidatus Baltobacteraceae bacterium]|nr:hypothetical protein [Candidatus Baltobacteraceae bacterium]